MAKYMISYDLHEPASHRKDVQDAIKSLGSWCKYVSTTYLVNTSLPIREVQDICTVPLVGNDRMLIAEITGTVHGQLLDTEFQWIQENI